MPSALLQRTRRASASWDASPASPREVTDRQAVPRLVQLERQLPLPWKRGAHREWCEGGDATHLASRLEGILNLLRETL